MGKKDHTDQWMRSAYQHLYQVLGPKSAQYWRGWLTHIQNLAKADRIFQRVARASKQEIADYLAEVWYAVVMLELGFIVEIEPEGSAGPDLAVSQGGHRAVIEITSFRRVYEGPPELSVDDDGPVLVEYGNLARDSKKVYDKIQSKFAQISKSRTSTSIICLWNQDGDLEEIDAQWGVDALRKDSVQHGLPIPSSLAFVVFGLWDDRLYCFPIRVRCDLHEEDWMDRIQRLSINQLRARILSGP